jgi:hypothetical protein
VKIDGGCHCGFITYEGEADPETATICHCADCQQLSGSAFRTAVPVKSHLPDRYRGARDLPEDGGQRQQAATGVLSALRLADLLGAAGRRPKKLHDPAGNGAATRPVRAENPDLDAFAAAVARQPVVDQRSGQGVGAAISGAYRDHRKLRLEGPAVWRHF